MSRVCHYAGERTIAGNKGARLPAHYFCARCPDAARIECPYDDWQCEDCEQACPCHTPPTPERIAAHRGFRSPARLCVMGRISAEEKQERARLAYALGPGHMCAECGKPVSRPQGLCRVCGHWSRKP